MERYLRQTTLPQIGEQGQSILKASSVCVVGAGALGIPCSTYLAGAGIGRIKIIDFDKVELSNLHRQVMYSENHINRSKVDVLTDHLVDLNSEIEVQACNEKVNAKNALDLLADADLIIDCTDNLESRYVINDACILLNKAFVSASVYRNEGQLGVFEPKEGASYRCLHPRPEKEAAIPNCDQTGVLGPFAGMLGSMQAIEVIKLLLGDVNSLKNKVLITSCLDYSTSIIEIERNDSEIRAVKEGGISYDHRKSSNDFEINAYQMCEIILKNEFQILDVREPHELPRLEFDHVMQMPMSMGITSQGLDPGKKIICICQHGIRSQYAALELKRQDLEAFSLIRGVDEYQRAMSILQSEIQ